MGMRLDLLSQFAAMHLIRKDRVGLCGRNWHHVPIVGISSQSEQADEVDAASFWPISAVAVSGHRRQAAR